MKVLLMRGISCSGKSTFVSGLKGNKIVCSADDYHVQDGKYNFRQENAQAAHRDCFLRFLRVVSTPTDRYSDEDFLIVDNTNTTVLELAPYVRLAETFGFSLTIVRLYVPFEIACQRNNGHHVPSDVIWRQYQNILTERLPSYWRETILCPEDDGLDVVPSDEQIDTDVLLQASERLTKTLREM